MVVARIHKCACTHAQAGSMQMRMVRNLRDSVFASNAARSVQLAFADKYPEKYYQLRHKQGRLNKKVGAAIKRRTHRGHTHTHKEFSLFCFVSMYACFD